MGWGSESLSTCVGPCSHHPLFSSFDEELKNKVLLLGSEANKLMTLTLPVPFSILDFQVSSMQTCAIKVV